MSFDVQSEMARRLRYHDRKGLLGVERFMKHYFLIAKDVGDLTRTICSSLELRQLKTVPTLSDFVGVLPWSFRAKLAATTAFRFDNGRLNVKRADAFQKDPLNLIRFFNEAERNNLLLHPEALRLIRSSLKLIDDSFRANPEANQLFLELLTSRNAPETSLRAMNEAGVLGRFIPEFGRVVAMMQFNMYHHYTIDEHTIRAIGILSEIEKGVLVAELPLSTEVISQYPKSPRALSCAPHARCRQSLRGRPQHRRRRDDEGAGAAHGPLPCRGRDCRVAGPAAPRHEPDRAASRHLRPANSAKHSPTSCKARNG